MKRLALVALVALAFTTMLGTAPAEAQTGSGITVPVTGTGTGTFTGDFTLRRFVATEDGVAAVGQLAGTVTDSAGTVVGSIVKTVTLLVTTQQATCDILLLELGPLHLDLLGLQIDLNRIVLEITAESGPGNLLGNLLCSIAGLLDRPSALANLLNQILAILG